MTAGNAEAPDRAQGLTVLVSAASRHGATAEIAEAMMFRGLNGDFRDWADIRQWAEGIAQQLALAPR
jgi:menaquinone-dependent protoporphyrinogen IX oxidase